VCVCYVCGDGVEDVRVCVTDTLSHAANANSGVYVCVYVCGCICVCICVRQVRRELGQGVYVCVYACMCVKENGRVGGGLSGRRVVPSFKKDCSPLL